MAHSGVFQLDRADPFAARFDHVLGTVGDLHVSVLVDRGDIARVEPAIGIDRVTSLPVIALDDPWALHEQSTEGFSIPRQLLAMFIDHFHRNAKKWLAL